jgi:hypothetical protein
MIRLILAVLTGSGAAPGAAAATDTLRIPALTRVPILDGAASEAEYGPPIVTLDAGSGPVRIRAGHRDGVLYIAADVPDSTFYWGDDVVVSFDVDGTGGPAPGAGDRAWIIRRAADSSVVLTAAGDGRWEPAGGAPKIGTVRSGPGWAVRTTVADSRWTMELKIDLPSAGAAPGAAPRIALRTFNDKPAPTWSTWPAPPAGVPAQRLDRIPDLWLPVVLEPARP